MYTYTVTQDFIDYREEKAKLYNPRGRKREQLLMDIDCEFYEWKMITEEMWEDEPDDWRIDAYMVGPDGWLALDVKFIDRWYNISPVKMCNILQQRNILHGYLFMEWISRPDRPLQDGDEVAIGQVGYVDWEELVDAIKPSRYNGHYADIRKLVQPRNS